MALELVLAVRVELLLGLLFLVALLSFDWGHGLILRAIDSHSHPLLAVILGRDL